MKIHEIFIEYIELKTYLDDYKVVLSDTTLYNKYIKPVYGNKEISTLNLIDYQNFANNLLSGSNQLEKISLDKAKQIINILINIYRFAIKSNYYQGINIPLELNLDKTKRWEKDLEDINLAIELGESFVSLFKTIKKVSIA